MILVCLAAHLLKEGSIVYKGTIKSSLVILLIFIHCLNIELLNKV